MLRYLHVRNSSESPLSTTLDNLLVARMAAKLLTHIFFLQAVVSQTLDIVWFDLRSNCLLFWSLGKIKYILKQMKIELHNLKFILSLKICNKNHYILISVAVNVTLIHWNHPSLYLWKVRCERKASRLQWLVRFKCQIKFTLLTGEIYSGKPTLSQFSTSVPTTTGWLLLHKKYI